MALEVLENVEHIEGVKIIHLYGADPDHENHALIERGGGQRESVTWKAYDEIRKNYPISIDHVNNSVAIKLQKGPIKENGVNGCQVADGISLFRHLLSSLNKLYPSSENHISLAALGIVSMADKLRTRNRELRGVEGTSQV